MDPGNVNATTTTGVICLQGGRELTPPCDHMDRAVLERSTGHVVVLAGAARPGSDYAGASARTVAHYRRLGVEVDVIPDPRNDPSAALDLLATGVGLVVLPGGSPSGLLDVLAAGVDGTTIGQRLVDLWTAGAALSGASAGAMVLCRQVATPDRGGRPADGLGLVPGLAVPHWTPGSERRWSLPDVVVWGLPECGGVLIDRHGMIGVGQGAASVRLDGSWSVVDRTTPQSTPG
jgi:hypothetical protein